jgi:hypothetical protein
MNRWRPVGSSGATAWILVRLCLVWTWSLDRPIVPSNGLSVHPTLLSSLLLVWNSSDAIRKWTVGSSDGALVSTQCTNSSDATRKWTVGSSDSALVFTQCTNSCDHCTDACYLGTVSSSNGVLSFSFLSHFWPLKNRLSSQFGMWYFGILGS